MQNLEDFIFFKTKKCEETLCPYFQFNPDNHKATTDYTECLDYHNYHDKRRPPYKDIPTRTLAYKAIKGTYNDSASNECNNIIELVYHPENFKALPCRGECEYTECPNYHSEREKQRWNTLLSRPEGSLRDKNNVPSLMGDGKVEKVAGSNKEKVGKENNKDNKDSFKKSQQDGKSETKFKFEEENDLFEVVEIETPQFYETEILEKQRIQISEPQTNGVPQTIVINKEKSEGDRQDKELILLSHQSSEKKTENVLDIAFDNEINSNRILDDLDLSNTIDNQLLEEEENNFIPQKPMNEVISPKERSIKTENTLQLKKDRFVSEIEADVRKQNKSRVDICPLTSVQEGTNIYYYNEKVDINENILNELKTIKSDDTLLMEEYIEKYVCGFLNSKGGTLYLGITDDGRAVGIKFDRKTMDDICVLFDKKLKNFSPPVRADQYSIKKCPVIYRKSGQNHKDYYVVEIRVQQGDLNELYFTDKQQSFIRKQASTIFLRPESIKDEIRARTKRQMAKNLFGLLTDAGFDDCLKGQSVAELLDVKRELEEKIKLINSLVKQSTGQFDHFLERISKETDSEL